jgi:hypothetical protein
VSSEQRRRLASAAADAGDPASLLPAVAHATLPTYTAGQQLADRQLGHVADAVELLAEAGLNAEQVGALIAACRQRAPHGWREPFWAFAVRTVRARARRARIHAGRTQTP